MIDCEPVENQFKCQFDSKLVGLLTSSEFLFWTAEAIVFTANLLHMHNSGKKVVADSGNSSSILTLIRGVLACRSQMSGPHRHTDSMKYHSSCFLFTPLQLIRFNSLVKSGGDALKQRPLHIIIMSARPHLWSTSVYSHLSFFQLFFLHIKSMTANQY